jgi:serine/threonine protein kinase
MSSADRLFRLDEPIGSAGFSEVWRATDTVLARPIAVKLLHPGCAQQPEVLARFLAEAQRAATLWHVNIAHIYDYDEPADGLQPYLVMELVDGPSLVGVLAGGPLSAAWTMDIVAQTAADLQAAHDRVVDRIGQVGWLVVGLQAPSPRRRRPATCSAITARAARPNPNRTDSSKEASPRTAKFRGSGRM